MLLRGQLSGTKVALVVRIYPISDGVEASLTAEFLQDRKQLVLAMKTAGGVIAGIFRPVELASGDDFQRDFPLMGEGSRVRQLGTGQAGRISDDGQHIAA